MLFHHGIPPISVQLWFNSTSRNTSSSSPIGANHAQDYHSSFSSLFSRSKILLWNNPQQLLQMEKKTSEAKEKCKAWHLQHFLSFCCPYITAQTRSQLQVISKQTNDSSSSATTTGYNLHISHLHLHPTLFRSSQKIAKDQSIQDKKTLSSGWQCCAHRGHYTPNISFSARPGLTLTFGNGCFIAAHSTWGGHLMSRHVSNMSHFVLQCC